MSKTILVVEDDASSRVALLALLEWSGYTVIAAGSAAEAEEQSRSPGPPIDLVLTDLLLAEGSSGGIESQLGERCSAAPVIYMSGYSHEDALRNGLPAGAPLVEKPLDIAALEALIARSLRPSARGRSPRNGG